MARTPGEGIRLQPFSSLAAARLSLSNRPVPERILAVAEYGYSLRFDQPPVGVEWCEVAAEVCDACAEGLTSNLRGRVLGYFGNSLRVVGNYEDAKETLERALKVLPGDPLLLEFKGSLLRDIRQLEEAAECLNSASKMRRAAGDAAGYARTILITAQVMDESGHSREAARFCLKALDSLSSTVDPARRLIRATVQNYATFMCNAGKPLQALRALEISKPLLEGGEVFFQLRVEWLNAKIASALGDESAADRLISVKEKLADGGLIAEAALATLDLARHYARQRDPRTAEVALSVAPFLQALGIQRDAEAAAILGKIALADATGTDIEHVDQLISQLYAAIAARPETRRVA